MNKSKEKVFVAATELPRRENKRKRKVFVAMSGGVDSSVAAALLKEGGYDVTGVFMKNWTDESVLRKKCTNWEEERADALKVASKLKIKFETWDFEKEYKERVIEYFFREYEAGRTPNPDVMCNKEIKFGAFLKKAFNEGAQFIATGHYARILKDSSGYHLVASEDAHKDQTYFLGAVKKECLDKILFPIGDWEKKEVRRIAHKLNLPVADKKDSQGICFVGEVDLKTFLKKRVKGRPGPIITKDGQIVGEHEGIAFYTIGQRRGLGVGGGLPYYVVSKNLKTNALVVARGNFDERLYKKEIIINDINWLAKPALPFAAFARIRYLQKLAPVNVGTEGKCKLKLKFKEKQRAVTPGQIAVLYKEFKDSFEVLASGTII